MFTNVTTSLRHVFKFLMLADLELIVSNAVPTIAVVSFWWIDFNNDNQTL